MVVLKTTVFRSMNFRVNPNRAFGLYGSGKSGDMIPDVFYQQCWRTPLDPIGPDIVGRIDVKRILGDAKGGFIRRALRLITSYADHREILKERLELEVVALSGHLDREIPVLFTSQKWWTHIANLHQWGILIHVGEGGSVQGVRMFGRYFAVPKTADSARAIFNGKPVNAHYLPPRSVNICDPPRVVQMVNDFADGKRLYFVMVDWRHYFHQLPLNADISRNFGVCITDPNGTKHYYRWGSVPMGWSWAPYVAQCIGWHIVTHGSTILPDITNLEEPPTHVRTTSGQGLVFLYYDNVHAYFTDAAEATKFKKQLEASMAKYRVAAKYARFFDTAPKVSQVDGTPTVQYPESLGVEYRQVCKSLKGEKKLYELQWRISSEKIEMLQDLELTKLTSAREIARVAGKILYRHLLHPVVPSGNNVLLGILSSAGKHQARPGTNWDSPDFALTAEQRLFLQHAWSELRDNKWIQGPAARRQKILVASDASDEAMGYGVFDSSQLGDTQWPVECPSLLPDLCAVLEYRDGLEKTHIYVREVAAATIAIGRVARRFPGCEIIVGVGNVAARFAVSRQASVHPAAARFLESMNATLREHECTVVALPIPGHYNMADWPSHRQPIPLQRVHKIPKAADKLKGFATDFEPAVETYRILRDAYEGRRISMLPESIEESDDWRHPEICDDLEAWNALADLADDQEIDDTEAVVEGSGLGESPSKKRRVE